MYKIPAKTLFTGQKLIYVPECHSTNSSLAGLLENADLPEGTVFITDYQTSGRGQRGNSWESGRGENLTFSLLFRPKFLAAREQFKLNMTLSLAVVSALSFFVTGDLAVKWPNDIMLGGRKVGGILIENQSQGSQLTASIAGIGININQKHLPFPQAGSLIQFTGQTLDLNEVLQAVLFEAESRYLQLRAGSVGTIEADYQRLLYKRDVNQTFESAGSRFTGVISGVDDSGRLCIKVGGEERRFSLKEVRMVPDPVNKP